MELVRGDLVLSLFLLSGKENFTVVVEAYICKMAESCGQMLIKLASYLD